VSLAKRAEALEEVGADLTRVLHEPLSLDGLPRAA
jgi:hypothetical protein